jgi:hypothetical protein
MKQLDQFLLSRDNSLSLTIGGNDMSPTQKFGDPAYLNGVGGAGHHLHDRTCRLK